MKKILIVKMSSMGDLIHTFPAITDAMNALPNLDISWIVEDMFSDIPHWHPAIQHTLPIALRRWRKHCLPWKPIKIKAVFKEWQNFYHKLRANHYDCIIDAQGLIKSASIAWLAHSHIRCGLDRQSAREKLATVAYNQRFFIPKQQHAITRTRKLLSQALGYSLPNTPPDYGINDQQFHSKNRPAHNTIIFIHGSSQAIKCWPEHHWIKLGQLANQAGFKITLPWGNALEKARAQRIAAQCQQTQILDKLNLNELAAALIQAKVAVTVDTGPGHLAAALNIPTVGLYGPTNPTLCGIQHSEKKQDNLYIPNGLDQITPHQVWQSITHFI